MGRKLQDGGCRWEESSKVGVVRGKEKSVVIGGREITVWEL